MKFDIYYSKYSILSVLLTIILIGANLIAVTPSAVAQAIADSCVQYDAHQKLIHISCKSIHLSDIYHNLDNASILHIENSTGTKAGTNNGKVWIKSDSSHVVL